MHNAGFVKPRNTLDDFPRPEKLEPFGADSLKYMPPLAREFRLVCVQTCPQAHGSNAEIAWICETDQDIANMNLRIKEGRALSLAWYKIDVEDLKPVLEADEEELELEGFRPA